MKSLSLRNQSKTSKYYKLYWNYYALLKKKYGIRVLHKKLNKDDMGIFDIETNTLIIDRRLAGKLEGLASLIHEFSHYKHTQKNLYPNFYNGNYYKNINNSINLIWKVEWDCVKSEKQYINKKGFYPNVKLWNKNYLKKKVLPLWIKYYLKIDRY